MSLLETVLCFSQIEVQLFALEKTNRGKGRIYNTTITFNLYIKNNSDSTIYFPYNANPINDENYDFGCESFDHKLTKRFYNLIESNDTFAMFLRCPVVDSSFKSLYFKERWSKYLHLNYYGHPKDGKYYYDNGYVENGFIDLIKIFRIEKNKVFHIQSIFQFKTIGKKFTDIIRKGKFAKGLYVKVVLFKEGMDQRTMTGDIEKVYNDSSIQPYIVNKLFYFEKWMADSVMKADITLQKFKWEDPFFLHMIYSGGGW